MNEKLILKNNLKECRSEKGLSQQQLADLVGVLFTFSCYNISAHQGVRPLTFNFVSKHQSRLNCWAEPSINYNERITYFFSAVFSEN